MWEKTVEENKWLHEQNDRLKGNRNENPTLRDQFAMAALISIPARSNTPDCIAEWAYEIADAMMKKR
jgi:hypothetical protein